MNAVERVAAGPRWPQDDVPRRGRLDHRKVLRTLEAVVQRRNCYVSQYLDSLGCGLLMSSDGTTKPLTANPASGSSA